MTFRKKPVVIEACQVKIDNLDALEWWCNGSIKGTSLPVDQRCVAINTLEGEMDEKYELCVAVDSFATSMKERLMQKQKEGFTGWDDKNVCLEGIAARLFYKSSETYTILNFSQKKNLRKKILVDIANFAMMIWRKL